MVTKYKLLLNISFTIIISSFFTVILSELYKIICYTNVNQFVPFSIYYINFLYPEFSVYFIQTDNIFDKELLKDNFNEYKL